MLPKEIIESILFDYLNDIELKITFGKIKKINLSDYEKIKNVIKTETIRTIDNFGDEFVYRFIQINNLKFYRLTLHNNIYYSPKLSLITEIACDTYPIYFNYIGEVTY